MKKRLRETGVDNIPAPITPKLLIKGYDLPTINILLMTSQDFDPDWGESISFDKHITERFQRINKVRDNLYKIYGQEFINHLTTQTTDQASRYAPVTHKNNLKKRDRSSQRIKHQFISISPENCTRGNNKSTQ